MRQKITESDAYKYVAIRKPIIMKKELCTEAVAESLAWLEIECEYQMVTDNSI